MMFFSLVVLLVQWMNLVNSQAWHSGITVNTISGITVGASSSEFYAAAYGASGSSVYYSTTGGQADGGQLLPAGGVVNLDVALSTDGSTLCVVGPGNPEGGLFCGPSQASFVANLITGTKNLVSQSLQSFGASSFGVVGQFLFPCDPHGHVIKTEKKPVKIQGDNIFGTIEPHAAHAKQQQRNSSKNLFTESLGEGILVNGVGISTDNGQNWVSYDIGLPAKEGYHARHGAFPSSNTFYVTWGSWPNMNDEKIDNGYHARLSSRVAVYYNAGDNVPLISFISARNLLGTYPGGISKTCDGGNTWQVVYNTKGSFYLNQISCADENNCVAVGENGKAAFIVQTKDGGVNWETRLTLNGPFSLNAVQMIDHKTIFVSGGTPSVGPYATKDWVGVYYQSTDYGHNWNRFEPVNGYGWDMSFKNGVGYATALFRDHSDVWIYDSN